MAEDLKVGDVVELNYFDEPCKFKVGDELYFILCSDTTCRVVEAVEYPPGVKVEWLTIGEGEDVKEMIEAHKQYNGQMIYSCALFKLLEKN